MNDRPQWVSTPDASKFLGVTLRTLYRFIDEGYITGYRFGRVIRVQQSDLEAFIESSRITPGSLSHLYPGIKGVWDHKNANTL